MAPTVCWFSWKIMKQERERAKIPSLRGLFSLMKNLFAPRCYMFCTLDLIKALFFFIGMLPYLITPTPVNTKNDNLCIL